MSAGPDSHKVRVLAPSKINLGLEVLGQRGDGFHELDTTMVALSLCDELELERTERPGVQLTVLGPSQSADIPSDERNLAYRAAAHVLERSGADGGLGVRLTKRIPSQSGLGGASSNAAAALAGAERTLQFSLSVEERSDLLGGLGSDCVFFEQAKGTGAAHCTGRGELVRPLAAPSPAWIVVLVCPDVHVSTATIFGALDAPLFVPLSGARLKPTVSKGLTAFRAAEIQSCLRNQLEDAAISTFPELRAWRSLFDATSGSVS
ncbi:MAG: 4-(cytidine 5'-diphospho)-2-C-methyl-D-erythritol kinase, partial [Planctomycetota bacterium]